MKKIYDNYYVTEDGKVFNNFKQLSPCDNGKGYLILGLTYNKKRFIISVHRLVAMCYIDNPYDLPEVNHKDGNRLNNHKSNLEWCTHSENIKHSYLLENRSAVGENNANCKTKLKDVISICEYLEQGLRPSNIRNMGFNYELIRKIKRKKTWTHISKDYNF